MGNNVQTPARAWCFLDVDETRMSAGWQLVAYDIPRGNVATYFPEANSLVPLDSTAADSNTPTSKWIIVTINAHGHRPSEFEEE